MKKNVLKNWCVQFLPLHVLPLLLYLQWRMMSLPLKLPQRRLLLRTGIIRRIWQKWISCKWFSKTSFYKDLNSLPAVKTGKTTVNVPAVTASVKSVSKEKDNPEYVSYVKFKAPKTGKYVVTLDNLQGTDDKTLRCMMYCDFYQVSKIGKNTVWTVLKILILLANMIRFTKTTTLQGSAPSLIITRPNIQNMQMLLRKRIAMKQIL